MDDLLASAAPVPVVDLNAPELPRNGLLIERPSYCDNHFGPQCRKHYSDLARSPKLTVTQCPFGFSSISLPGTSKGFALTGFVPFPRLGGDKERARSRDYPDGRIATTRLLEWAAKLEAFQHALRQRERDTLSGDLEAVHEVRRLNQTVKVVLERLCDQASPGAPERADENMVRAWKASVLISHQMDALDVLSNPDIATARPDKLITFYKLVDNVQRIYKARAGDKHVRLRLTGNSFAKAFVYDGTIHIVPSAFIDNAVKYSQTGDEIEVRVFEGTLDNVPSVGFEVVSVGPIASAAEERRLFKERGRGDAARALAQGSGAGLLVVQAVAEQHRARVSATQTQIPGGRAQWRFRFEMPAHGR